MNKYNKSLYYLIIIYFTVVYFITGIIFPGKVIFSIFKEVLIILLFMFTIKKIEVTKSRFIIVIISSYLLLLLLNFIRCESIGSYLVDIKYYLVWPLFIPISRALFRNKKDIKIVLNLFKIISLLIGILGYYYLITGNKEFLHSRFTTNYAIMSILPTHVDFGMLMYAGILSSLIYMLIIKDKIIYNLILIMIYNFFTYYSFSRTSYIAVLIIEILFLYNIFNKCFLKDKLLKISVNIMIVTICIPSTVYLSKIISNLKVFNLESLMIRMNYTWKTVVAESLIIGDGFGVIGSTSRFSSYSFIAADNMYNRIIINIGVIGMTIILLLILRYILTSYLKSYSFIIILSLLVASFFADIFTLTPSMIMIYSIIGITIGKNNELIMDNQVNTSYSID